LKLNGTPNEPTVPRRDRLNAMIPTQPESKSVPKQATRGRSITSFWALVVLFVSGYAPLPFILGIKYLDQLRNGAVQPWVIVATAAGAVLSVLLLRGVIGQASGGSPVTVRSVSHRSADLINYTLPYLISFLGFDFTKANDIWAFTAFFVLLCWLVAKTESAFMNPILAIWGYGFYEVEYEEYGVEKRSLVLSRQWLRVGSRYAIRKVAGYVAVVTEDIAVRESL